MLDPTENDHHDASMSQSSRKRSLDSDTSECPPTKIAKAGAGAFRWIRPLETTCLRGVNLAPKSSPKVAAFDLDGTIIASTPWDPKQRGPKLEWQWFDASVPRKLAEAVEAGYSVVIFTNQAGLFMAEYANTWRQKMRSIANAMGNVPFRVYAAKQKDKYFKPLLGMWEALEREFAQDGIQIDKSASFYVGERAGRNNAEYEIRQRDKAATDRQFALNAGVAFQTPEQYFRDEEEDPVYAIQDFHASSLSQDLPLFLPNNTPLIPNEPTLELVIFVGLTLGKTTLYNKYFAPRGYKRITGDDALDGTYMRSSVEEALAAGERCVVDGENLDRKTRSRYLSIAKEKNIPVRCMLFKPEGARMAVKLARHIHIYRGLCGAAAGERARTLNKDFDKLDEAYQEPTLSEGFTEVRRIYWTFEGSEEERKIWNMWLLV
ncbi:hypothetical protein MKEN_01263500 [Mycena kentingensis (nom. inval.)]|nr:hypothetical protein MKEN_01263500 [Mycena kentingensis (nom. inval.)]